MTDSITGNEIAIIGMVGRFPGAENIVAFWNNLKNGVDSITHFTDEELAAANVEAALYRDPNYVRSYGMLDNFEAFDASFFGFSPNEAEILDPQHRLFLECAWHALEDSGYSPHQYGGLIGVFAGVGFNRYLVNNLLSNPAKLSKLGGFQAIVSNEKDYLTTRVSYKLDLRGPSINIQTACSTSLVAVHVACQSLLAGECDMALVGGVSIGNLDRSGYMYQAGSILSPDGKCRAFDAQANGTVFGDGVALVVLKRLAEAVEDGDHIEAVIKGSAVNNDGSAKVGYTAPSASGQTAVFLDALSVSGVAPETISYLEAHGTGTPIGDPIEIAALTQAYGSMTAKKAYCALGSVKTNVGHLDIAAGVTGLIKTVLSLKHRQIPPTLHFQNPNPQIDFANSPFFPNATLLDWSADQQPRRAAVNSLGIGGTNAHVILEEAPLLPVTKTLPNAWYILPFSARTPTALNQILAQIQQYWDQNENVNIADLAYTLQVGRVDFNHRAVIICQNDAEARHALATPTANGFLQAEAHTDNRLVAFLFPGQGAQFHNMGRSLYDTEPIYKNVIDDCAARLYPYLGLDLRDIIYPDLGGTGSAREELNQTWLTQPALFVVEYALAQLWLSWGIKPHAMIGHSIGEYVAACLSGVMSLDTALYLVAYRGQLMQKSPQGAMLAVSLPADEARPFLNESLSLAAINAPDQIVLSGSLTAVAVCEEKLAGQNIPFRRLMTSHAFHSPLVESILPDFARYVAQVTLKPPQIPFISTVTGHWITPAEATDNQYWVSHLRHTVQFASGLQTLSTNEHLIFLEVGPGQALSNLARRQLPHDVHPYCLASLPTKPADPIAVTMGKLWLTGVHIDWKKQYTTGSPRRISLPGYPFQRRRHWVDINYQGNDATTTVAQNGKNPRIADWFYFPGWRQILKPMGMASVSPMTWLIMHDAYGVGEELARRLREAGHSIVDVMMGPSYTITQAQKYVVNPQNREDFSLLLADLAVNHQYPQRIVHLWAIQPNPTNYSPDERYKNAQSAGFFSLLFLAQAIGEQARSEPLHMYLVSNNVYAVLGDDALCPEQALLQGPGKVIPLEYPHITCTHLDITLSGYGSGQEQDFFTALYRELVLPDAAGQTIVLRGKHRWQKVYEPIQIPPTATQDHWHEGGVYLITGGLGGLGLTFALYLARTIVDVKLILTGRSALPAQTEWDTLLDQDNTEETAVTKIRQIQELASLGATVLYLAADAADQEAMAQMIKQVQTRYGRIHGVIHAAGLPGNGIIQWKDPLQAQKTLAPKTWGTLHLLSLLQGEAEPEFILLCSSINALFGGFGAVDYCAANAFLDAQAQNQATWGNSKVISVNWDTWQQVGMAANANYPAALRKEWEAHLREAILPKEGGEVLNRLLCHRPTQVLVATQNYFDLPDDDPILTLTAEDSDSLQVRPDISVHYAAPRNSIERRLVMIWQKLLGVDRVGIHDDFFAVGGHSLLAIQILSEINDTFDVSLPLAAITKYSTVAQLAEHIVQKRTLQEVAEDQEMPQDIEEMLAQIEGLSEEEIIALLEDAGEEMDE